MRVLVDECLPRFLRRALTGHTVETAQDCGWSGIKNGQLLLLAEERFDVFLTGDKNLRYQQNLKQRKIAIVELSRNSRAAVRVLLPQIIETLVVILPGAYIQIGLPSSE